MFLTKIVNYIGDLTGRQLFPGGPTATTGVSRVIDFTKKSVAGLFFQQGKPVLDAELNAVTQINRRNNGTVLGTLLGSGFPVIGAVTGNSGALSFDFNKSVFVFNGINHLNVSYNLLSAGAGNNRVTMNAAPGAGTRTDLVYMEMWFEEVEPTVSSQGQSKVMYVEGGSDSGIVTNDLYDSVALQETTRMIQFRWKIRVKDGVNFTTNPLGLTDATILAYGANAAASALPFTNVDGGGLFVAGVGTLANAQQFLTVEGYVYSTPLFSVLRTAGEGSISTAGITPLMQPMSGNLVTAASIAKILGYAPVDDSAFVFSYFGF